MNSLTLTYSGAEKFLVDWGYASPVMKLVSQAPSTFSVQCPGGDPATNTEDIPNWGVVTIRMNRTFSGGSFSGGTIIFVGRRTDFGRRADPTGPGTMREFSDPWYDLTQTVFQHYWKEWNGTAFVNVYFSRLNMFQDITAGPGEPWTYLTTYGQLLEIIAYAGATCGCNLQSGTIDPTWTVPSYAVKAITCAEAIVTCLKPMADVVTYFDYTTTPPTLHIRQREELGSQTLPFAGTDAHGRAHQSSDIKSREDLQPTCVAIQYQTNTVVDDKTYLSFTNEIYPGDGAPQAMGSLVVPIDLRGTVTQTVKGQVTAVACDPTSLAFWKGHKKELGDARITGLALVNSAINDGSTQCITIKDAQGNNVSLSDFPNEQLPQGDVASWMKAGSTPIIAKNVTITGYLKYEQSNPAKPGDQAHKAEAHQVSVNLKLTNSATHGVDDHGKPLPVKYSAIKSFTEGDPAIVGLAQNVYDSLSQLQWEGSHSVIEQSTIYAILSPALNLNLSGGATAWTTMNAAVYSVMIDFTSCRTDVSFGPHKHLTAGEFLEYLLLWRQRQVYNNPSLRSDGKTNDANDVQMPEDQPVDDTTSALPDLSKHTIAAPQADLLGIAQPHAEIQLDATSLVDSGPLMGALPPDQRIVKPRKMQLCINGAVMQGVIISGPPMTS